MVRRGEFWRIEMNCCEEGCSIFRFDVWLGEVKFGEESLSLVSRV